MVSALPGFGYSNFDFFVSLGLLERGFALRGEGGGVPCGAPGTLDLSFNGTGFVTTPFYYYVEEASAMAVQADGKIVVTGAKYTVDQYYYFALVRYNVNGTLDTSFG